MKTPWLTLTYRTKLLFGILLVGIMCVIAVVIFKYIEFRNYTHEKDLALFTSSGLFLADMIGENLAHGDTDEVVYHMNLALKQPDIKIITIMNSDGIVLFSSDSSLVHKPNNNLDSPDITIIDNELFFKTFPLRHSKQVLSLLLQLGYSLNRTHHELSNALLSTIFIGFLVIFITALVSWIISGFIRKPMREMQTISERMATGDFSMRLPVKSHDEIGQLAEAINKMADQLQEFTNKLQEKIDRATSELKESNEKLKELDTLKSNFVSMVSHDIKAPLASIVGFADTLLRIKDLPATKQMEYLNIIKKEGLNLARLAENFLDITKIESGSFKIKSESVNVKDLIFSIKNTLNIQSDMHIETILEPNKLSINADPELLKIVIINIMENSIKYTDGKGKLVVSALMQNEELLVSIEDNGPGIPETDRHRIFEKYYRGSNSKKSKGSGLGLTIAKNIVEAHNGRIWCDSAPGKGMKITFVIPKNC